MFQEDWTVENIVARCKRMAAEGFHTGILTPRAKQYMDRCTVGHAPTGTVIIFSHDRGMHDCGCWKNPDYNQCQHLSLSFRDPKTGAYRSKDKELSKMWVEAFYGPLQRLIWTEPPYYPEGKKADVWHYRVFFSHDFEVPILPRAEVYSKTWTPAHWLSWSDYQAKLNAEELKREGVE